jgi:hypothetical protein
VVLIFALIGALAVGGLGIRAVTGHQDGALQPPPQTQADVVGATTKLGTLALVDQPLPGKK